MYISMRCALQHKAALVGAVTPREGLTLIMEKTHAKSWQ